MKRRDGTPYAPQLIQDIEPSRQTKPRSSSVSFRDRAAIGDLQDDWQKQARLPNDGLGYIPHAVGQTAPFGYTRVAPLSSLELPSVPRFHSWFAATKIFVAFVAARLVTGARKIGRFFTGLTLVKLLLGGWHWRPTKYTLHEGLKTNWHTRTFAWSKRFGLPLIGLMLLLFIGVTVWQADTSSPRHQSHTQSSQGARSTASISSTTSSGSAKTDGDTSTAGNTATTSSTTATTDAPVTGGRGGSGGNPVSTAPGTGTTPGIPGVTTPYPVTVPGQSVQLGGKQVVGTGDTTITLN